VIVMIIHPALEIVLIMTNSNQTYKLLKSKSVKNANLNSI